MLHDALLLLPDFLLIVLGLALVRLTALNRSVWDGMERLVYFVLFPALLFSTTSRGHASLGDTRDLVMAGAAMLLIGIALAYAAFWARKADRRCVASGVQTAFRFNSYIALAAADRVGGPPAVSLVAVLIALGVPLCNVAAVWALAVIPPPCPRHRAPTCWPRAWGATALTSPVWSACPPCWAPSPFRCFSPSCGTEPTTERPGPSRCVCTRRILPVSVWITSK